MCPRGCAHVTADTSTCARRHAGGAQGGRLLRVLIFVACPPMMRHKGIVMAAGASVLPDLSPFFPREGGDDASFDRCLAPYDALLCLPCSNTRTDIGSAATRGISSDGKIEFFLSFFLSFFRFVFLRCSLLVFVVFVVFVRHRPRCFDDFSSQLSPFLSLGVSAWLEIQACPYLKVSKWRNRALTRNRNRNGPRIRNTDISHIAQKRSRGWPSHTLARKVTQRRIPRRRSGWRRSPEALSFSRHRENAN